MSHDEERSGEERRGRGRLIALGVVAVALVWFGLANSQRVQVSFFGYDRQVRLVVALAVAAGLGFVGGYVLGRLRRRER